MRKAGELDHARQLAERLLEEAPDNRYNRQAAAWVYLEYLKTEATDLEKALPYLEAICGFRFDSSDKILWEQLYWQVAKVFFRMTALPDAAIMGRFWGCWKKFVAIPGQAYSVLLKALLKHGAHWTNLPIWVELWGWGHLQAVDFEAEELPSGKKMPSLAERAYLAVAKVYLEQTSTDATLAFLDRLDAISEAYPGMLYLVYYRALLRLKMGRPAEALQFFIPFAQKKHRDFWVWDLLAQLHPHDSTLQLACLAKALTCKTSPEFLVKIRHKMAAMLVAEGRWIEARTEIEQLCQVREANHWRIPSEVVGWINSVSYQQAEAHKSNAHLYTQWAKRAEKLLQANLPEVIGVVWAVNEQKQTAQFIVDEQVSGGFNYAKYGFSKLEIGQVLALRLQPIKHVEGSFWQVQDVEISSEKPSEQLVKPFVGVLRISGQVGFVGQVMVRVQQLDFDLTACNAPEVMGRAVRAFDQKKQKWGWKAINVVKKV